MAAHSKCMRRFELDDAGVNRFRSWSLAGAFLAVLLTSAFAQEQTTATYEDWTLRCALSDKRPAKFCDVEQLSQLKGNGKPFSRVVISPPTAGQPLQLIIQVPVNVWLATAVKIQIDGKETGLMGPFGRCTPAGCFARIALKDSIVRQFSAARAQVRIVYADAAKGEIAIPLSLKGFSQAFNALTKE